SSSSDLRLCACRLASPDDLCEHIGLAQDQVLVRADLDLGPAVLGEDDLVAVLQVHGDELAVVVPGARADSQDAAALRLLLGRVRKHDAAHRRLLFLEDLDDQAVTKRLQVHTAASCVTCFRHSRMESARTFYGVAPRSANRIQPEGWSGSSPRVRCSCDESAA